MPIHFNFFTALTTRRSLHIYRTEIQTNSAPHICGISWEGRIVPILRRFIFTFAPAKVDRGAEEHKGNPYPCVLWHPHLLRRPPTLVTAGVDEGLLCFILLLRRQRLPR